ncbi:MAG: hypothetical protein E6580_08845 [Enterococcus faecalis]|nr:hypothetical protein [Acinetobacter sp.]MDU6315649.1 hypothetical protein [Enterococcus faecalis]
MKFVVYREESYLKDIFNFLGIQDVFVVRAEGMAFPTRSQSISKAINSIPQMFAIPAPN